MEGRTHTAVTIGLLNPQDPTHEREWNRWYDEIHVPDMLSLGQFPIAARYQRAGDYKLPGDAHYMVLTETTKPDPQAAYDKQLLAYRALPESRKANRPATQIGHIGVYKLVTEAGSGKGKKLKGILIAMANSTDPTKEDAFRNWYDNHHIPEVLGTGSYYAATRYVSTKITNGGTQFLVIYETDWEDAAAAHKESSKIRATRTPRPEYVDIPYRAAFQKIVV